MIYLDNNATTRIAPEVTGAMQPFLNEFFGNPSSAHAPGRAVRQAIETARLQVAAALGAADASEIVFTSCGTESNNWSIFSALEMLQPDKNHIVTTRVEHESVARVVEKLEKRGYEITFLEVDSQGLLDLEAVRVAITPQTALVSVMLANNETGVLFPVTEIARIVKEKSRALVHVDGVQAVGKLPLDLKETEIDLFAISGHKFHAPKGTGALYIKRAVNLPAFLLGGGQERGRRAGTESLSNIVALGAACELAQKFNQFDRIRNLRDRLENEILKKFPFARLNGTADADLRLPNTSNISFAGLEGESILAHLDARGVFVSTGSACNSETHAASPVLQAMNVPYQAAMGAIRFSLSRYTTAEEIDSALPALNEVIENLRAISPFHG